MSLAKQIYDKTAEAINAAFDEASKLVPSVYNEDEKLLRCFRHGTQRVKDKLLVHICNAIKELDVKFDEDRFFDIANKQTSRRSK